MPPHRGSRLGNPSAGGTVLRVKWQHRTVAILRDTTKSVIQQAADHFRLGGIIDDLVLVGKIDGEELELTTGALCLLPAGATVNLTRISATASIPRRKEVTTGGTQAARTFIHERKMTIHFAAVFHRHPYTMSFRVRPTCVARKLIAAVADHLDMEEMDLRRALDHIHPDLSLRDNGIRDGDIIDFLFG